MQRASAAPKPGGGLAYRHLVDARVGVIVGWTLSRTLLSLLRLVSWGAFAALPGFLIVLIGLFLAAADLARARLSVRAVAVVAGVAADSVAWWLLRPGAGGPFAVSGPFDLRVFAGSAAALVVTLGLVSAARAVGRRRRRRLRVSAEGTAAWILVGAAAGAVLALRVAHVYIGDLPNAERSLIVAGVEVHHAVAGAILALGTLLGLATRALAFGRAAQLVFGVAVGLVLDQASYLQLAEQSDPAYTGAASVVGAAVATALFAAWVGRALRRSRVRWPKVAGRAEQDKLLSHRLRGFAEMEHTPSALAGALRSPARYLEVDTRATCDGALFLYHDPRTGADVLPRVNFASATAAAVRAARFVDGQPLLTLDEALARFRDGAPSDQRLCLDIKDFGLEDAHVCAVRRAGLEARVEFVTWIPQTIVRLHEAGVRTPLILSHINVTRLGAFGRRAARWFDDRTLRLGRVVLLGTRVATRPLGSLARGYQHGLVCRELPPELVRILAGSGGGVCVHEAAVCDALVSYCRREGLRLWIFSVVDAADLRRAVARDGVDVVFCDDVALLAEQEAAPARTARVADEEEPT